MDNIIKKLNEKNWPFIKKSIETNKIRWDHLVDQTNGTLHYLAYHDKFDLIQLVNTKILREIINIPNIEGDTVCHIAAKLKNIDLLTLSIDTNPKIIYEKNKLFCTPLFYLVSDNKLIRQIIKTIEMDDHYLNNEYTILEYYILTKNFTMMEFIFKNIKHNKFTNEALFTIIQSDNITEFKLRALKIFKEYSIDLNSRNNLLLSPLVVSIYQKEYEITEFLLENGADINYYGPENNDHLLTIAIKDNNAPTMELLMEYDINIGSKDKYLQTPLHHLFENENTIPLKIKQTLLNKINNINSTDIKMNSILNLLVHNDNWRNYENILEGKKLKIYLQNKNGVKPIDGIATPDLEDFFELVYKSYLGQLDSDIEWSDGIDKKISLILENGYNVQSYKDHIMGKIMKGQSYPLKKNNNKIIKLIIPPKTNITHFSAYTYNYICFLYYILEKYPTVKIPSMAPNQMKNKKLKNFYDELVEDYQEQTADNAIFRSIIRDYVNHSPILINHVIIWKNNRIYFFSPYIIQGIYETLIKFPHTHFILLKLTIVTNKNFNHANILIYDVKNKYVERFDPYGNVPFYYGKQIDYLLEAFFKEYFSDVKYLSPAQLVDGISFQILSDERNNTNYVENDPSGFCVAWCLWYVEMRIKNPEIQPKSLIKKTINQINKNEDKFKDYIRNYSNYLDSEKNNILEKAGIPKKYWYMMHMPITIYKAYLKYIRNIYNLIV
jgi:ankyrin repeat protein